MKKYITVIIFNIRLTNSRSDSYFHTTGCSIHIQIGVFRKVIHDELSLDAAKIENCRMRRFIFTKINFRKSNTHREWHRFVFTKTKSNSG
jgi:hypothetical protein